MNEKLIQILGLPANASEDLIVSTVAELKEEAAAKATTNQREKRIRSKIAESGGALNREQAIMAIDHQDEADEAKPKKAKK